MGPLERQLVVGVDVAADAARHFGPGAPATPRAAYVLARPTFGVGREPGAPSPFEWDHAGEPPLECNFHHSCDLTPADAFYLGAAAAAADARGAPIVVVLPPGGARSIGYGSRRAAAVVAVSPTSRWIIKSARLDFLDFWEYDVRNLVAASDSALAIADGWGRPYDRVAAPRWRRVEDIAGLPWHRVVFSAGVRHRTQLRAFGGHGYGAALAFVGDQPGIDFAAAAPLLAWYLWPAPKSSSLRNPTRPVAASTESPRRGRGAAASRLRGNASTEHNTSTSQVPPPKKEADRRHLAPLHAVRRAVRGPARLALWQV